MALHVAVNDGVVACNKGTEFTPLRTTSNSSTSVSGKQVGTIVDSAPFDNFGPFGNCIVTGAPCTPVTCSNWSNPFSGCTVEGQEALLEGATLPCSIGGNLQVVDPGQAVFMTGRNKKSMLDRFGVDVEGMMEIRADDGTLLGYFDWSPGDERPQFHGVNGERFVVTGIPFGDAGIGVLSAENPIATGALLLVGAVAQGARMAGRMLTAEAAALGVSRAEALRQVARQQVLKQLFEAEYKGTIQKLSQWIAKHL